MQPLKKEEQTPGETTVSETPVFLAPASAALGVGSGLPGGIGATEGVLGVSPSLNGVPAARPRSAERGPE